MYKKMRLSRLLLFLISLCYISQFALPQDKRDHRDKTGEALGVEVVFVVDVSPPGKDYQELVEKTVAFCYDAFQRIPKTSCHLITFAERAKLFENKTINKNSILDEISKEINKKHYKTYPKHGLGEVFDLVAESFPQKPGIVLFISSGQDSRSNSKRAPYDLERTIHSLKKNGFTVFAIFLSVPGDRNKCQECMRMISGWANTNPYEIKKVTDIPVELNPLITAALNLELSSPTARAEMQTLLGELQEELEYQTGMVKLLGKSEKELTGIIKEQEAKLDVAWIVILLLLAIMAFFLKDHLPFIHYRRKKLWGKLKPLNDNRDSRPIDLSRKSRGDTIITPSEVPNFKLYPCSHCGRKVLCAQVEKGCINYLREGERCKTTQYIDAETNRIIVSTLDNRYCCEYEYHFLNVLKESCKTPSWEKGKFWGCKETLTEIKENFLKGPDCNNIIISGMGNSGKTSLLRHLANEVFKKDKKLKRRCSVELVEYDPDIQPTIYQFEKECENKLKCFSNENVVKKILLIDDYDKAFFKFGNRFKDLITQYFEVDRIYLVLAGRRPGSLMHKDDPNFILPSYKPIILNGIDKPRTYSYSIKLIDSIIEQIGFRRTNLGERAKKQIAYYASGLPYFCKRILLEMLSNWLEQVDRYSLRKRNVRKAVMKIAAEERDIYLKKNLAELDEIFTNNPKNVSCQDIIDFLSKNNGKAKKDELLACHPSEEKLDQLKGLGLIVEIDKTIMGIPHLFYQQQWEDKYGEII